MKIFSIAISFAFLGASYCVGGNPLDENETGGALKDGICSVVRGVKACPLANPLSCAYETITTEKPGVLKATMKHPCAAPIQPDKCNNSKDNEQQCLNDGCTWVHWTSTWGPGEPRVNTECEESFSCNALVEESACNSRYSSYGCKWEANASGFCYKST